VLRQFRKTIRDADLSRISNCTDEVELLNFVAASVGSARYWQNPDEIDEILADAAGTEELRRVAEALGSAPASAWWPSALALTEQVLVDWRPKGTPPPHLTGARTVLHNWKQATLAEEKTGGGGTWWSPPIEPELAETTRHLSNLGAVALLLLEDSCGDIFGDCWNVRCRQQPRVYELNGPKEWTELVGRYALEVTQGRRGAWVMATGLDVRWFLPDWSRVAEDFDAVHLSVSGYLAISGRPLLLDDRKATFLAGWDPDKTFWLADMLELSGTAGEWESMRHNPSRDWCVALSETY